MLNPRISTRRPRDLMKDLAKARAGRKFTRDEYLGDFNTMQAVNRRIKTEWNKGIKKRNAEIKRLRLERKLVKAAKAEQARKIEQMNLF